MAEIVSKNPVNDPSEKGVHTRSTFDLGQNLAQTERFGDVTPRFALEVVPGDKLPYNFAHNLRTHTLGAPFMGDIYRNEDAFFVPMECILPKNWDKIYTNPLLGDDVDASLVGCNVHQFVRKLYLFFNEYVTFLNNDAVDIAGIYADEGVVEIERVGALLKNFLTCIFGMEMIFSNGSLPALMGAHLSNALQMTVGSNSQASIDKFVDWVLPELGKIVKSIQVSGIFPSDVSVYFKDSDYDDAFVSSKITLREFLEIVRDGVDWDIESITYQTGKVVTDLTDFVSDFESVPIFVPDYDVDLSLARFFAYQIVCAHYYSNDKVDYVYDANLYRQNVYDAYNRILSITGNDGLHPFFFLNGSSFEYDYLSSFVFASSLTEAVAADSYLGFLYAYDYLRLIFGFNRSLRYVDYFTGAKTRPLAVGDVNASVSSSQVNVVDITRNIQKQRFLNAVNRAGRRISEYVKSIFGVSQAPDYHNPFFLSHERDTIGHMQVENTGDGQRDANSVTSMLLSQSSRFQFEFECDRPGILIGVVYYDIERYYFNGVERLMQHVDRYDMFNPFMQFTGDQEVRGSERDIRCSGDTFGYQMKYMEYKQRYSQAAGGFIEYLPGYIFLADDFVVNGVSSENVSPSFIRSRPSELDRFYTSLTGYSLASYFHFIVINRNMCDGSRPMAYAPSIL